MRNRQFFQGNPISESEFESENGDKYVLTIFDNQTYAVTYPPMRTFSMANTQSVDLNTEEYERIDRLFKAWLITALQKYYEV